MYVRNKKEREKGKEWMREKGKDVGMSGEEKGCRERKYIERDEKDVRKIERGGKNEV